MLRTLLARSASLVTSQLGTQYEGRIFCFLLLAARQVKWRGKLNLKTVEKSWHTVLCCSRSNEVSCRNHSSTPGISIHAFQKEEKQNQIQTTFTRIHMHRLAWKRNTLPCALSILNHRISAEVCLLGHQWISGVFTLRKVQYRQYTRSQNIHWTLITQEMREDLQIVFLPRNVLWMFLWDSTEKRQYPKSPPPPPQKQKNSFLFGLGKPIRDILSIFRDDRSTTLSTRMDLF